MRSSRLVSSIVLPVALAAATVAGCNEGQSGANDLVSFTPRNCGNELLGCSFDKRLALWADTDVQIEGIDGFSTAGIDLASADPALLTVTKVPDVGGRPTWSLHAAGVGLARLSAVDSNGDEVDYTGVEIRQAQSLTLTKVLGEAVGPSFEGGAETWTVNAGQPVSFQARMVADGQEMIGRIGYTLTVPSGSPLPTAELNGSAPAQGYLYVMPPAGNHPFTMALEVAPDVEVDAVLKAQ